MGRIGYRRCVPGGPQSSTHCKVILMSRSKSFFRRTVSDLCPTAGAALCLAAGAAGTAQAADIYGLTEGLRS